MGGTRLGKEVNVQRTENYYDLNLNQETSRYIFRIVAIKEIIDNPTVFGFELESMDKYAPLPEAVHIKVDIPVPNLGDFAIEHGTTYRMLKIYNPWLRSSKLSNKSKKEYLIKVPKK